MEVRARRGPIRVKRSRHEPAEKAWYTERVQPLPLVHVLVPALACVAVAALFPLAVGRLFGWVYLDASESAEDETEPADGAGAFGRAMGLVELATIAIVSYLAATAWPAWLGRTLETCLAVVTAVVACTVVLVAGALLRWRGSDGPGSRSRWTAALGRVRRALPELLALARPDRRALRGAVLGSAMAVLLASAVPLSRGLADVTPEMAQEIGATRALVALDVRPSDGEAMLALAWHARRERALGLADARADAAAATGADGEALHLVRAEIAAARGDCEAARAEFRASIEAQARKRFSGGADESLVLGGYTLPPTLVRECDSHGGRRVRRLSSVGQFPANDGSRFARNASIPSF